MKYILITVLLAVAVVAGYFSVSTPDTPLPVVVAEAPEVKKKPLSPGEGQPQENRVVQLPPKPVKAVKKAVKKPQHNPDKKDVFTEENPMDSVLEDKLLSIDSRLYKRRQNTLKEMFERLPNLSEDDKKLLTKLILLYDQSNFGSNKDEKLAGHIDTQIANLLSDDYEKFEQRSSYKMLNDLHNILKKNPLEDNQEQDVVNYFNRNMDSGLINKLIAVEFNRNGFKDEHNPLLETEPIKEQMDIWKDAPVTDGQAAEMKNVYDMILIGLGRAAIESDLKKIQK